MQRLECSEGGLMPRLKAPVKQAEETGQETVFDFKKPFQKLKPETFWEFIQQYPDWEACAIYVYRLWPVIDRRLSGHKEKYIDVLSEKITEIDLLRKHGSGKYQLMFNDSNKPKGLVNVASCKVELNDPMFEPVVPLEEVVEGADANKSYIDGLRARGTWKDASMPAIDHGQAATAELARTLTSVVDRVMEREQAPPPPPPPQDPFAIAMQMLKLMPTPPPPPDPTAQAMKLLEFIRANEGPQEKDPLETYTRIADLIDRRTRHANPAASGGGINWGEALLGFVSALPQLVQGFVAMKAMMPQQVVPAAFPAGQPGYLPPTQGAPMPEPDLNTLFLELKPYLMKAIMQGQSGDEFASGLVTFLGEDRYKQVAGHGLEGILGALRSQSDLWMLLSPYEEAVRTFIQEFLDYGKPETPEAEEQPA
jgi:hypothetical protein